MAKDNLLLKNQIIINLVSVYGWNELCASQTVFSVIVCEKIDSDIEWSQHMGADYWAKEIDKYFEEEPSTEEVEKE